MRSLLRSLLCFIALSYAAAAEAPPEIPREFRGAWVPSVYNLGWPSRAGLSAEAQKKELEALLDDAVKLRLNAILLQVRPASDALYTSKLEPWSAFLTGKMGQSPGYDPLAYAIQRAHARGLELHAWFNPFRALVSAGANAAPNHVSRTHPEWIRRYGAQAWVDPGEPAARAYVQEVMLDVVRRYDLDGLHIDDYFYPYPLKDKAGNITPFPDGATYERYGKGMPLGDWRRENINRFVQELYRGIKAEKRTVKFGISPFGVWRPRVPASIEAKLDAYGELYADSRRWLAEGWCDYFSPQLYWSTEPAAQSFPVLLKWWREQNRSSRHLWPGIATERIGPERPASEMTRQIGFIRQGPGSLGEVHWEMKALRQNRGGIGNLLSAGPYKSVALPPASPWLAAGGAPKAPTVTRSGEKATWSAAGGEPRWWAVQWRTESGWYARVLPGSTNNVTLPAGVSTVAVRAVDAAGQLSPAGLAE